MKKSIKNHKTKLSKISVEKAKQHYARCPFYLWKWHKDTFDAIDEPAYWPNCRSMRNQRHWNKAADRLAAIEECIPESRLLTYYLEYRCRLD